MRGDEIFASMNNEQTVKTKHHKYDKQANQKYKQIWER